jgi:hypothetical protein
MKKIINVLFAVIIIALSSCTKQPAANISTDKTTYVAGDVIHLTNTSVDASSYLWTCPNGQTLTAENIDYTTDVNTPAGTLTFTLLASSANGKKNATATKTVTITAAKGNAIFWQLTGSGHSVTVVSVNGITSNITSEYSSAPSCGAAGCAVFNDLEIGTYNFGASDGTVNWSGTVTITKDGCTTKKLL